MHFELYNPDKEINLPVRKTAHSAGYDFFLPQDTVVPAHGKVTVQTNITIAHDNMDPANWMLNVYPRSSYGTKKDIIIANTVGIVDYDYCGFEILICLYNRSDVDVALKAGDSFVQGIFTGFFITSDDAAFGERIGGFGSTGK